MDRFWSKVDKSGECWEWVGATTCKKPHRAYGQFWFKDRLVLAHRFSYEMDVGVIPDGMDIDHLCRNTRCVNPQHLEPVTRAENVRRAWEANPITHCIRGHELNEENTYVAPTGKRTCWICKKNYDRNRY